MNKMGENWHILKDHAKFQGNLHKLRADDHFFWESYNFFSFLDHYHFSTAFKHFVKFIKNLGIGLVNCPTQPICFAYFDLCIFQPCFITNEKYDQTNVQLCSSQVDKGKSDI